MQPATHETLTREETVAAGSDRSFGFVMAAVFLIIAAINGWHDGHWWPWTGAAGVLFLAAALLYPPLLGPLNRLWFRFGLLLHKVVNPIVMGLVFYGAVLPTGLVMRALGHDLLRLRRDAKADSYWIRRQPPGPAPQSMVDQF